MNAVIVESFAQMVREKGIDKDILIGIISEIFGLLVKKKYGEDVNFDIVTNMDRGDIEIYLIREVVEVVEDPNHQISLDEVKQKGNEDELDIGEDYVERLKLESFGRRLINFAKQSLNQRIRELEKDIIYNKYKEDFSFVAWFIVRSTVLCRRKHADRRAFARGFRHSYTE